MPTTYKRSPNIACKICNKAIYRRPSEIQENKGNVFCSITCYGIHCRKEHPCVICGKLILSRENKKTCSRSCSNINRTGIKYHMGRPKSKVTSLQILKSRLIKERGAHCQRCGYNKFGIIEAHHRDRNRLNNDFGNLELICPNCHSEEHFLRRKALGTVKLGGVA